MRFRFLQKFWGYEEVIRFGDARYGECDSPDTNNKKIRIRKGLKPKKLLEILIHEGLHALYWHLDEEYITDGAADMRNYLWRLGVRPLGKYPDLLKEYDRREKDGWNG